MSDLTRLSDQTLGLRLDIAVERVQAAHRILAEAQAERQALYDERERRDAERGITRPGEPCRACGACYRCYLGEHGTCHGCRCDHDGDGDGVRCDHGTQSSDSSQAGERRG